MPVLRFIHFYVKACQWQAFTAIIDNFIMLKKLAVSGLAVSLFGYIWCAEFQTAWGLVGGLILLMGYLYYCLQHENQLRQQTENKLENSELRYRALFENSGTLIIILNKYGIFQLVNNKAAAALIGGTARDLIGKSLFDIFPKHIAKTYFESISAVIETGVGREYEETLPLPSGQKIFLFFEQVIKDTSGQGVALQLSGIDITERKRAELELRKLSRAVQQSDNSIIITNREGTIEFINASFTKVTGYTLEEAVGHNCRFLKSGYHSPEFYQALWNTISNGEAWYGEFINKRKNGEQYWEATNISPIKDRRGNITHYVAVKDDITARKQAEEALQQAKEAAESANRAKSIFLATMSHELRTPLNSILGYAQVLKWDEDITPQQREGLNIIQQSGEHLLGLINDILDLSKIEAGKVELHPTEFDLLAFLQTISEIIRVRAEYKDIYFDFQFSLAEPHSLNTNQSFMIYADEQRLRQVLINLLGNAIKFTETGGVTLKVRSKEYEVKNKNEESLTPYSLLLTPYSMLRFEISDTGVGITPADWEAIFEPFKQVGQEKYMAQGTGLGLAISRNLVQLMGGELQLTSELGKGSTFWFELVAPIMVSDTKQVTDHRRIIGLQETPPKILVVDDNTSNRRLVVDFLSSFGFEMIEASNGREGLAKAHQFQPQAIITDLIMPEMDGFELIKQIRNLELGIGNQEPRVLVPNSQFLIPNFKIVIIASSASVYDEDRQKCLAAGANDFVPKPVKMDNLLTTLQKHLSIEWQYEALPLPMEEAVDVAIIPPSAEVLHILAELVLIGDISGLRQQAVALQADERLIPFSLKLDKLASEFQLSKIGEMINEFTI